MGQRSVLLIPGVGGHPAFHRDLISGLSRRFRVHTAPYLDFATAPCADWEQHVAHWERQFQHAADGAPEPPSVVGISFGAHVSHALRLRNPGSIGRLALVSYRHLTIGERRLLSGLARAPRMSAFLVGHTLLRLSEVQAHDRSELLELRRELYDEERLVRGRLTARLSSLASAPPLHPSNDRATFVFGVGERTLRRRHARGGGTEVLVSGRHSISIRHSPELLHTLERAIGAGS
jgi:pimeloyl-ACP methyl ester carboxylesterase